MRDSIALADRGSSAVLSAADQDDVRCRSLIEYGDDWRAAAGCGRVRDEGPRWPRPVAAPRWPEISVGRRPASEGDPAAGVVHLGSFALWKQFLQDNFPWLELRNRGGAAFEAAVTLYRVGRSLFSTFRADACDAIRSRHLAEASQAGYIKVIWQLSGRTDIEQDGRSFGLEAGQVGVCDTSRPYRIRLPDRGFLAVLLLPYDTLPQWPQLGPHVCGRSISESTATRAALAALMSLNSLPVEVVASEGGPVITAVKWMLSNTLRGEPAASNGESSCGALIAKARRHIAEHVADPTLGPDHVASALCMSRRSLYLLFKEHGLTPAKMIHDIRLNQAKRCLEDPGKAHQKMTHVALDAGFADYATFSRLFKVHFGVTPSAFRSQRCLALCA